MGMTSADYLPHSKSKAQVTTLVDVPFTDRVLPQYSTGIIVDADPYFYLIDFGEPGTWRWVSRWDTNRPIGDN